LPAGGTTVTTDANGEACLDGLVLSSFVGDYTALKKSLDASPWLRMFQNARITKGFSQYAGLAGGRRRVLAGA
jgi:hypothetical protein